MLHTNFDFEEFDLNYELIHWLISKINRIDNANTIFFWHGSEGALGASGFADQQKFSRYFCGDTSRFINCWLIQHLCVLRYNNYEVLFTFMQYMFFLYLIIVSHNLPLVS